MGTLHGGNNQVMLMRWVSGFALIAAAVSGAATPSDAQTWTGGGSAAGLAFGNHFGVIYFRCEAPGRVQANVEDKGGVHAVGSRQQVVIRAAGRSVSLSGTVTFNGMDEVSTISPSLDRTKANALFDMLSRGSTATVVWPKSSEVVPLEGSAKAIAALRRNCLGS